MEVCYIYMYIIHITTQPQSSSQDCWHIPMLTAYTIQWNLSKIHMYIYGIRLLCLLKTLSNCYIWQKNDSYYTQRKQVWRLESNFDVKLAEGSRDTPRIRLLIFIIQWLDLLCFLGTTQSRRIGKLEELWRKLDEPFWINCRHFTHVFFGRHHQLMIDHPKHNTTALTKTA